MIDITLHDDNQGDKAFLMNVAVDLFPQITQAEWMEMMIVIVGITK